MATIPIFNQKVPFLGQILNGFQVGKMIRFKAVIGSYTDRLQIYFQTGPALIPRSDVPLHLSIRPAEGAIVRNSMRNQIFEHEERYGGFPIQVGNQFEILILVEAACFKIAVNGVHFCTFNHRMPFYQINFISVDGGPAVSIIAITSEYDNQGTCVPVPPPPPIINYPQPTAPSVYPHHDLPPPYTPHNVYPNINVTYVPPPPPPPPPKKSGSGLRIATAVTGGLIAGSLLSNRRHHGHGGRHHHHHC